MHIRNIALCPYYFPQVLLLRKQNERKLHVLGFEIIQKKEGKSLAIPFSEALLRYCELN